MTYEIKRSRWGTYQSFVDGKPLILSLTEEQCRAATDQYLYWMEHGFPEAETHEGVVFGKL